MLISDAIAHFEAYIRFEKRYSPHTCTAYMTDLQQWASCMQKDLAVVRLQDIGAPQVRTWLAQLADEEVAPRSIRRKISALQSFFKYHLRMGHVAISPVEGLPLPKTGKRLPQWLEEDCLLNLFELNVFGCDWEGKTARLAMQLLYETGLRRSELLSLCVESVDLPQRLLKVKGKGGKERIIPIGKGLAEAWSQYLEERQMLLELKTTALLVNAQGRAVSSSWLYRTARHYLGLVTSQQKRSPHVLRHSFATHLTNAGAGLNEVKELLGHSSLAATQVYTHNSIERLKKIHQQAHPGG